MSSTRRPLLNVSSLKTPDRSEDQMSVCEGQSSNHWTDEEQTLLEENLQKMEVTEANLKSLFQISLLFPNKTIQQLMLRVHWLDEKDTISWEDYCKKNVRSYSTSPKDSPHASPRYKPTANKRSSIQLSPKRDLESRKKRRSVPNVDCITDNVVYTKSRHNSIGNSFSDGSALSNSTGHYVAIPSIQEGVEMVNYNTNTSPCIQINRANSAPRIVNYPKVEQTQNTVSVQSIQASEFQGTPQFSLQFAPVDHIQQLVSNVNIFLERNESILNYIQESLATGAEINTQYIEIFGTNLQNLLSLTDEIAKPLRLPFLQLLLTVPPNMSDTIDRSSNFAQPIGECMQ